MQKICKIRFQEIFNVTNIHISFVIHVIKTFFNLQRKFNYRDIQNLPNNINSCYNSERSKRKIKRNAICPTSWGSIVDC